MNPYPLVVDILERQGEDLVTVEVKQQKNLVYYDLKEEVKIKIRNVAS
jgi:Holliday junction resolvase-like predicted endonuclease